VIVVKQYVSSFFLAIMARTRYVLMIWW